MITTHAAALHSPEFLALLDAMSEKRRELTFVSAALQHCAHTRCLSTQSNFAPVSAVYLASSADHSARRAVRSALPAAVPLISLSGVLTDTLDKSTVQYRLDDAVEVQSVSALSFVQRFASLSAPSCTERTGRIDRADNGAPVSAFEIENGHASLADGRTHAVRADMLTERVGELLSAFPLPARLTPLDALMIDTRAERVVGVLQQRAVESSWLNRAAAQFACPAVRFSADGLELLTELNGFPLSPRASFVDPSAFIAALS